jgi:hypothetical protein
VIARLAAVVVAAVLFAAPAAALGQSDPFGPIPQAPQQQPTQTQPPSSSIDDSSGISNTQLLLIALAGAALLGGIAWAIVRDARQAAPPDARDRQDPADRTKATRAPPQQRVARNRAKARAARQARKRAKRR